MAKMQPSSSRAKTSSKARHKQGSSRAIAPGTFGLPLWSVGAIALVTTAIFFRAHLFGGAYFWEDFAEYVYPAQVFAAKYLRAGELPFWNPYSLSGAPFLADVAVGFFYPPNMAQALFTDKGGVISPFVVQSVIIAHFALAQFTMFLLVRSFGVSDWGALFSAVSYGFSSYLVCHAFHPMMLAHCAWFPLAWLHFRAALIREDAGFVQRLRSSLLSGLTLGVMMLSGHPQTTLYLTLFLFFFTLWTFGARLLQGRAQFNAAAFGALASLPVLIGAGIFAVQLLHSQEFAAYSERSDFSLEKAAMGSLELKQIWTLLIPKLFGYSAAAQSPEPLSVPFMLGSGGYYYWETAFYVGVPALILGVVGFVVAVPSSEGQNLGGFLLFASLFAFAYALGVNGFLFEALFRLPLFDRFRIPSRMLILFTLSLSVMAGMGFDALRLRRASLRLVLGVGGVATALAALGGLGVLPALTGAPTELAERYADALRSFGWTAFVFAALSTLAAVAFYRGLISVAPAGTALAALAFLDVSVANGAFNQSMTDPSESYRRTDAVIPASLRADGVAPDSLFRVSIRGEGAMLMSQNQGLFTPIMLYEGYMPILIRRRLPLAPDPETTLDLLNVRFAVARGENGFYLRERPNYFPRARLLFDAVVATPETAAERAKSGEIDFRRSVLLEETPSLAQSLALPARAPEDVRHTLRCAQYSANSITYEIDTEENGILTLSEIWYPAWKAYLDGKETPVYRVNYSLRGVLTPKGRHTVVLRYESSAFCLGAWISAASLCIALGGIIACGFVAKKAKAKTLGA